MAARVTIAAASATTFGLTSAINSAECARHLRLYIPRGIATKRRFSSVALAEEIDQHQDMHAVPMRNSLRQNQSSDQRSTAMRSNYVTRFKQTYDCSLRKKEDPLPPPLPEPKFSFFKRVLPENLTSWSSEAGQRLFTESLLRGHCKAYFPLAEHFVNQSDPAYCGVTTLLMVLNAMSVDPQVRWKGGWRFYGDESVLLHRCCLSEERIQRVGIVMEEFAQLAKCQGVQVDMHRPLPSNEETTVTDSNAPTASTGPGVITSLEDFRRHVIESTQNPPTLSSSSDLGYFVVVSFARAGLDQTGDGHFSPVAAYHKDTDQVLIMDVARFKYKPFWVSLETIYEAMQTLDSATQQPRGWFRLRPDSSCRKTVGEGKRPANLVPLATEPEMCPLGEVKVKYCSIVQPQNKQN